MTHIFPLSESVVQATKSARNSAIRYYIGIALAILFFGGFLVRSYWEEYTFNRDTKKLLAYYKHVVPGSIADGDDRNAMHIVWKYRSSKQKLWAVLEKKYGVPVREAHEWDGYKAKSSANNEGDAADSDSESEGTDQTTESTGGADEEL